MAWTTPGTATAGEVLTAAFWNEQVRDNLTELAPFFGAWTDYTPTFTNFTLGNGLRDARYIKIGRWVQFYIRVTLGSTSSVTGSITVSLPFTARAARSGVFSGFIDDVGTTAYLLFPVMGTTGVELFLANPSGTNVVIGATSATSPMTWTTNDAFVIAGSYEAAS